MKKLKKYRAQSPRDDFHTAGRHIHSMHIRAFVNESVDFTEKESAHFDVCRDCRLKVIDACRNLAPQVADTIETDAVVPHSRLNATGVRKLPKVKQARWRLSKQQGSNAA